MHLCYLEQDYSGALVLARSALEQTAPSDGPAGYAIALDIAVRSALKLRDASVALDLVVKSGDRVRQLD